MFTIENAQFPFKTHFVYSIFLNYKSIYTQYLLSLGPWVGAVQ